MRIRLTHYRFPDSGAYGIIDFMMRFNILTMPCQDSVSYPKSVKILPLKNETDVKALTLFFTYPAFSTLLLIKVGF